MKQIFEIDEKIFTNNKSIVGKEMDVSTNDLLV